MVKARVRAQDARGCAGGNAPLHIGNGMWLAAVGGAGGNDGFKVESLGNVGFEEIGCFFEVFQMVSLALLTSAASSSVAQELEKSTGWETASHQLWFSKSQ